MYCRELYSFLRIKLKLIALFILMTNLHKNITKATPVIFFNKTCRRGDELFWWNLALEINGAWFNLMQRSTESNDFLFFTVTFSI
jgi:hypothetical protein